LQCQQLKVSFFDSSQSTSNALSYAWDFGDGQTSLIKDPIHSYATQTKYNVKLVVTAGNGCMRDTFTNTINFIPPVISAGPDIQVVSVAPVQLQANGGVQYHWEPSLYLDNPDIANPTSTPKDDVTYVVTGFNKEGCSSSDTLKLTLVKNLLVEVPNAFDPVSAKNHLLRPLLRMIDHINYFKVYNRWGQLVFETKEMGVGWDGKINGQLQPAGIYVWQIEAVDYNKNVYRKNGSSMLVR
jgi:gliding motility-associated-like protein